MHPGLKSLTFGRRHPRIPALFFFAILATAPLFVRAADETPKTRQAFAKAMNTLSEGMSAADAQAVLGRPDSVRIEDIPTARTKEIWCFGVDPQSIPMLGCVFIDVNDRVQFVFGKGEPPSPDVISEEQLREALRVLAQTPARTGSSFDPARLVMVVNSLQPLGKEKALAAIREYLRVTPRFAGPSREGVFLVLRLLFELPRDPGYMPEMRVGAPLGGQPADPLFAPLFPLALVDDIPFLLVPGYALGGKAQQVEEHVEHFEKTGALRAKPLTPGRRPLESIEKLLKSPQWFDAPGDPWWAQRRVMVEGQVIRMLKPVYSPPAGAAWPQIKEDLLKLPLRWDRKIQAYSVNRAGTSSAPAGTPTARSVPQEGYCCEPATKPVPAGRAVGDASRP